MDNLQKIRQSINDAQNFEIKDDSIIYNGTISSDNFGTVNITVTLYSDTADPYFEIYLNQNNTTLTQTEKESPLVVCFILDGEMVLSATEKLSSKIESYESQQK